MKKWLFLLLSFLAASAAQAQIGEDEWRREIESMQEQMGRFLEELGAQGNQLNFDTLLIGPGGDFPPGFSFENLDGEAFMREMDSLFRQFFQQGPGDSTDEAPDFFEWFHEGIPSDGPPGGQQPQEERASPKREKRRTYSL